MTEKIKKLILIWIILSVCIGTVFAMWLVLEPENIDVIQTTQRIQQAEVLIEELNGMILNLKSEVSKRNQIIKTQLAIKKKLQALATVAVRVDSAAAKKAKEWGFIITK